MLGCVEFLTTMCPAHSVGGDSTYVDLTTSNQIVVLPTLDNGDNPRWVYIGNVPAGRIQFNVGLAAVDSKKGPMLSAHSPVVVNTAGRTHYAASTLSGTYNDFCVTPIESLGPYLSQLGMAIGSDSIGAEDLALATTQEFAIPTTSNGKRARFVMIQGHNQVSVKPGFTGEDIDDPAYIGVRCKVGFPLILNVSGYTHVLAVSMSGNNRNVAITPLEI